MGSVPVTVSCRSSEERGGGRGGGSHSEIFTANYRLLFSPTPPLEMLESNNLVTFEGLANSSAYHTFLLDEERGRLVVGAKDHIFSFNLLNVSRDYAKVTQKQRDSQT